MTMLTVNNMSLTIGEANILDGVSAELKRGELVGLVGPNGAGKSSLLKAILGLVETSGEVMLDGHSLDDMGITVRAKQLSYAAQGAPVHWPLLVEHVVGLGRMPHLNPWQKLTVSDEKSITAAITATDCMHLKGRTVTSLSGGERARVLLARVLASDTPYILADEPVASLDPAHQLDVMDILKTQATDGKGVMVVLHDLALAARYCDRIIMLDEGKTIGQDTPDVMLSDAHLADVFGVKALRVREGSAQFLVIQPLKRL